MLLEKTLGSWNPNILATWCEELTHWKDPDAGKDWRWEKKGDDRGWDGWMASLTWWMWIWVNSRSWWWIGRPGVLRFMGSQRVRHDWATEVNWGIPARSSSHNKQWRGCRPNPLLSWRLIFTEKYAHILCIYVQLEHTKISGRDIKLILSFPTTFRNMIVVQETSLMWKQDASSPKASANFQGPSGGWSWNRSFQSPDEEDVITG